MGQDPHSWLDRSKGPIKTIGTTEAVVQRILEMIESGALPPGSRLPSEGDLSAAFGVGRSSIREAKRLLMAKNVLETRGSRGSFICEKTSSDVLPEVLLHRLLTDGTVADLQEARELIEVHSMELAVERADPEDLQVLATFLDEMEQEAKRGRVAYEAGLGFHVALVSATHNTVLERVYELIADLLKVHQAPTYFAEVDAHTEYVEHRRLHEALAQRDKDGLVRLMRSHLAYVKGISAPK
jgi:GntR family transcriptional regulator, transcriptional repressor for pyruvate dehydrogenase complex